MRRLLLSTLAIASCTALAPNDAPTPGAEETPEPIGATLPANVGSLTSTQMRMAPGMRETSPPAPKFGGGAKLLDTDTCETCHADVAAMWSTSAHAFGSFNNPIYRSVVDHFREVRTHSESQFCGGCHDLALMSDDVMKGEVHPTDVRTQAGISCRVCHGIRAVRADGNASYDFEQDDIPLPKDGDAESVAIHKARTRTSTHNEARFCAACHRSFLDEGSGHADRLLMGEDDATAYFRSIYAGSLGAILDEEIEPRRCQDCHMPKEPAVLGDAAAKHGTIASHRFLGGHTWLASMRGDDATLARVQAFLRDAVSVRIAAAQINEQPNAPLGTDAVALAIGDRITLDVVVKNEKVGHRFPGGVTDVDDTWIEVDVRDAKGNRVGGSGLAHDETGDDDAHALTLYMAEMSGRRRVKHDTHDFTTSVWNHTLEPRQAGLTRYAFQVPNVALPLTAHVALRHRTRILPIQEHACERSRTARGRGFTALGKQHRDVALDPCKPQPITTLGEDHVVLGANASAKSVAPDFAASFAHAQGLLRALQEYASEARPAFERTLTLAQTDRQRAMALWGLAAVAAREGQMEATFALAERAERFAPGHPALARVRAAVKLTYWQWDEAADWFGRAVATSPRDDGVHAEWTMALGGAGKTRESLHAARETLRLQPRDADALRVQAMALRKLTDDPALRERAEDAYLHARVPDDHNEIRARCSANVPGCARERAPVHVHWLR